MAGRDGEQEKQMTAEEIQKVHQAMMDSNGNKSVAARLLGVDRVKLRDFLRGNSVLRERWLEPKKAPTAIDVMARENPTQHPGAPDVTDRTLLTEAQIEKALQKDNQAFRKGLEGLGLKDRQLERMLAIQAFSQQHFTESLQLIGGGVTVQAVQLMSGADDIIDRLSSVREQIVKLNGTMSAEREMWVKEETTLVRQHLEISREVRSMAAMSNDHAMKMAILRYRKNNPGSDQLKSARKPGFQEAMDMPNASG